MIISIMYVNYLKYNDLWRYILRIKWFFELKFDCYLVSLLEM